MEPGIIPELLEAIDESLKRLHKIGIIEELDLPDDPYDLHSMITVKLSPYCRELARLYLADEIEAIA